MSIEGIRERQRLSVIRAAADQIIYDHCEQPMKIDNQKLIRDAYPDLFDSSVSRLHDGWTDIITTFLAGFHELGEGEMSPGEVRFEREVTGITAFCWPNPEMEWTSEKTQALIQMQHRLHLASQRTCEWCGMPGAATKLGDRVTIYLCEEDAASAREKLSAKVQAFDERIKFRGEVSILFQERATVWLHVGDVNTPILRKALLDIKKIVEDRGLIGKVFITKVMESEGQLFISARCDNADPATQFEIQDIIKHAEWQSDQAHLAANKEDMSDDT
ncbi:hypothetical protein [Agrobacterium sp.]|uniref:hypothetical protein n=1 Tax=Agrobacterium sp. TaxID=361 RepID=UPI00289A47EB|nr:hypothetical protein [Agrobacterium sp.]